MIALLFLVLIGAALFFTSTLSEKLNKEKRQVVLLTRQINMLRAQKSYVTSFDANISIKYLNTIYNKGYISKNSNLYIAPLENSYILNSLLKNVNVSIFDKAEVKGISWYEVSFETKDNINNKGWIKASDLITSICNTNLRLKN